MTSKKLITSPFNLENQTIAVTGGNGFIGSHLMNTLLKHGANAFAVDVVKSNQTETPTRVVDILDIEDLENVLKDVTTIYHLAGPVLESAQNNPSNAWNLQVQGTINVCEAARRLNIKRIILASSFYVYSGSDQTAETLTEESNINLQDMNVFGASKYISELIVLEYARHFGLECVCLRIGSVYGVGRCTNLIGTFIEGKLNNETIEIWGEGNRLNQFIHTNDVVDGLLRAVYMKQGVYNLVSPDRISTKKLADLCEKIIGTKINFDKTRSERSSMPFISSEKIKETGWSAISVKEGLKDLWKHVGISS